MFYYTKDGQIQRVEKFRFSDDSIDKRLPDISLGIAVGVAVGVSVAFLMAFALKKR